MKRYMNIIFFLIMGAIAFILIACGTPSNYAVSASYGSSWGNYGYHGNHHRHYRPPPPRAVRRAPRPMRR